VAKRLARRFTFGRSRVLTPVAPDQVWVFFRGFPTPPHRGMSHITDKAYPGSVSISQYLLRQCGGKGFRGGMKDVSKDTKAKAFVGSAQHSSHKLFVLIRLSRPRNERRNKQMNERASERANENCYIIFSIFFSLFSPPIMS
jgi:hypothetical protein